MTTVPHNLTLIREDSQKPGTLSQTKARMMAAPTDYVMVVGLDDIVDISGSLVGFTDGVRYVPTHVATRRAARLSKPVRAYNPVLLTQFNYLGRPILHKSLIPLFPETAVEPWHTVMVRAQSQGASFIQVNGDHTIVEPWPRPERSGAYSRYSYSFDPVAVMEAVPTILVQDINHQPFYTLRNPRAEAITAFCRNCSPDFMASLAGPNVSVQTLLEPDFDRIRACNTNLVAWFEGIFEVAEGRTLSQLQVGLEFPGVEVISPRVVTDFTPTTFHREAFSAQIGITTGFHPAAWMARTRDLGLTPPDEGFTNAQAILRKIP